MDHRYEDVYSEFLEAVPELRLAYVEDERSDWEIELERAGQHISEEDREYLREIEARNPEPKKSQEPLLYIIFESELVPLICSYSQHSRHHQHLAEIMNWLEDLAAHGDLNTRNLVVIAICEGFIGSDQDDIPHILPFMGEVMRQTCRDLFLNFRVEDSIKTLFGVK